jgi:hypothetical protein
VDDSDDTGMTRGKEPDQRLSEHQMKLSPGGYTASRFPVQLVYSEYFDHVVDAMPQNERLVACQEESPDPRRLDFSSDSINAPRRQTFISILKDASRPGCARAPQREGVGREALGIADRMKSMKARKGAGTCRRLG